MRGELKISENVLQRLRSEKIAWLTTVSPSGNPQPAPIWFLYEDKTLLIYSRGDALRNRNIQHNAQVSFNLNSNERGTEVVILWGRANIETATPPVDQNPIYLEKYRSGITRIGMTPESFAATYSVAIRMVPERLKAF